MTITIKDNYKDLLERPIVVSLVTLMPDNQPQASPVWFDYDGSHIRVNTARGRQKDINMTERPQVTVLFVDPDNPYRYMEVRGTIDGVTEEGALDHINSLSDRYFGRPDFYAGNPDRRGKEVRVIYKIKPDHVVYH